jgi:tetratricopeptide (TPR) repeat protein
VSVKGVVSLFMLMMMLLVLATPVVRAQAPPAQPAAGDEQRWKAEHDAGLNATQQGLYSQAVRSFQAAIAEAEKFGATDLRLAQSVSGMAQAYLQEGSLAAAERRFQQALAIYEKAAGPSHPNVALPLNGLATLNRLRGRFAEAARLARRSLDILEGAYGAQHPNVAIGQNNLAMILRLRGDYSEARLLSERSLAILEKALGPDHVNVAIGLNNLVLAYLPQGDYAGAESLARRALSIFEKTPAAGTSNVLQSLENLAEICRELGKYDESEQLYRRVLSVRWAGGNEVIPVLEKLADVLNLAFFDMSRPEAEEALQAAPGWSGLGVDLYVAMVRALRDRALTTAPERVIRRAMEAFPDSLEARYELARGYAETHRYQTALDALEQALLVPASTSADPGRDRYLRSRIHEEIARMQGLLSQPDEALGHLKTAIELDPANAHAFVALGDLYLKLDRPEDAAEQYALAVLLNGGDAAAYYGIAEVNRRLGRYPQAVMAADRALEIDARDTRSSYVRAAALLRDGRREEGEMELERYRALEANDRDAEVRERTIPVKLREAAAGLDDGRGDRALEILREAAGAYPDSAALQLHLGLAQSRSGRHRDAIATFQATIERGQSQDAFLVHLNLAREYEVVGETRASRLHRLLYLQRYDAFLKNKRR